MLHCSDEGGGRGTGEGRGCGGGRGASCRREGRGREGKGRGGGEGGDSVLQVTATFASAHKIQQLTLKASRQPKRRGGVGAWQRGAGQREVRWSAAM